MRPPSAVFEYASDPSIPHFLLHYEHGSVPSRKHDKASGARFHAVGSVSCGFHSTLKLVLN